MKTDRKELERIRRAYAARERSAAERSHYTDPAAVLERQWRERLLLAALGQHGTGDLRAARVLDVGCGVGDVLAMLAGYGASPERLFGIDLLQARVLEARRFAPQINFACGDAAALPYCNGQFDLVMQFGAFTSVLDSDMKTRMASEMRRVLRPGGIIIWYDFWLNPTNREVRGIGRAEICRLFPDSRYQFHRTTLAPPIARPLARRSVLLCRLLSCIPFLLSHYLAVIVPQKGYTV